jgi:hypothetical protein
MDIGDCGVAAWHMEPVPEWGWKSRKHREVICGTPHELFMHGVLNWREASGLQRPLVPQTIGPADR